MKNSAARRDLLKTFGYGALLAAMPSWARAHTVVGPVQPPIAMPAINAMRHDGMRTTLPMLLHGKATAMHLMFTGCGETCPLQGVLFSETQKRVPQLADGHAQLLSLSIDPLGDDARSMNAWLRKFGAGAHWIGAIPAIKEMDTLRSALQIPANQRLENHSGQVYLFDKRGMMVWRLENLPPSDIIARQLIRIART